MHASPRRAGFTPVGQGACGEASVLPRFCTKELAPVCARRGPNVRTFRTGARRKAPATAWSLTDLAETLEGRPKAWLGEASMRTEAKVIELATRRVGWDRLDDRYLSHLLPYLVKT